MFEDMVAAIAGRGLSSGPIKGSLYSAKNAALVRQTATTFASISVFAGLLALYWFVRMKRQFRHV